MRSFDSVMQRLIDDGPCQNTLMLLSGMQCSPCVTLCIGSGVYKRCRNSATTHTHALSSPLPPHPTLPNARSISSLALALIAMPLQRWTAMTIASIRWVPMASASRHVHCALAA